MEIFELIVDERVITWKRNLVTVRAESLEEAVKKASEEDYDDVMESEYLSECDEYVNVNDNNGYPTVEIFDNCNNKPLWTNAQ